MSLAPQRHRIIGTCTRKQKLRTNLIFFKDATIWDLETGLQVQNIGHFASEQGKLDSCWNEVPKTCTCKLQN